MNHLIPIWAVLAFSSGFFTAWLAGQKGYSVSAWLLLGWCFSILALITMAGAPDKISAEQLKEKRLGVRW